VTASAADLRRARGHAVAEVEAVLAGIASLRLQIGVRTLAGDPIGGRLRLEALQLCTWCATA
jgi:hypothetical protein